MLTALNKLIHLCVHSYGGTHATDARVRKEVIGKNGRVEVVVDQLVTNAEGVNAKQLSASNVHLMLHTAVTDDHAGVLPLLIKQ
jgi:hypothetical protein